MEDRDIYDLGLQADLAMFTRTPIARRQILKMGAVGIGLLLAFDAVERCGGRRVAGHHEHLRVAPFNEFGGDLVGEVTYFLLGPRTVGISARVSEIDDLLVRQQVDHRTGHGEPAEPRIEERNGAIWHRGSLRDRPEPLRVAIGAESGTGRPARLG